MGGGGFEFTMVNSFILYTRTKINKFLTSRDQKKKKKKKMTMMVTMMTTMMWRIVVVMIITAKMETIKMLITKTENRGGLSMKKLHVVWW